MSDARLPHNLFEDSCIGNVEVGLATRCTTSLRQGIRKHMV